MSNRLPKSNKRNTCVINKVRIWVDVFSKRETEEKSVNFPSDHFSNVQFFLCIWGVFFTKESEEFKKQLK